MKFVCFDDGAINEIISGRQLQSIDYEDGRSLMDSIHGDMEAFKAYGNIVATIKKDGKFFTTPGSYNDKKFLVIDCDGAKLFQSLRDTDALTSLQKIMRFSAKYWSGAGAYNSSERMISGTSKSILFPLPFSTGAGFRVAIEREPMRERLTKRGLSGRFLLVYKSGFDGADSATEEASTTNFSKVIEELPAIYRSLPEKISVLQTKVDTKAAKHIVNSLSLDDSVDTLPTSVLLSSREGIKRLTTRQMEFINAQPDAAQRLVGAAGTGKTTTLVLRTLTVLHWAEKNKIPMKAVFLTHSNATKLAIVELFESVKGHVYLDRDRKGSDQTLAIETLSALCMDRLKLSISETELIDRDAQDSKIMQGLYIENALKNARGTEYKSHKPHLSARFRDFFEQTSDSDLAPLFQHEISVQIKGRSGDSFDKYKECPPLKYGLPIENNADKGFIFSIFHLYQDHLSELGQFDTDDVVLSAINQLDTPIWRRRRQKEGFDFIAMDEAHLFNINELHIIHYLTREQGATPISYAIDKAQAVGDRSWTTEDEIDQGGTVRPKEFSYKTVFRSSPAIIEFSASILVSGATLFSNFTNSLNDYQSGFTIEEERKTQPIKYYECAEDASMVDLAFSRADELMHLTNSRPWEVLVTCLSDEIFNRLKNYAQEKRKPITILDRRGDLSIIQSASRSGHMLVGHADYVGGLEFNAVVVVGIDKGRVPFEGSTTNFDSRNFQKYVAHNRLYVACSRAKFALEILGVKARGPSEILARAFSQQLIDIGNA